MLKRRKLFKLLGIGSLVGSAGFGYASCIERTWLAITRVNIPIKNLPADLDGFKIAHLTDFHLDPHYPRDLLQEAVTSTLDENPDMIALTGDFISHEKSALDELLTILQPLASHKACYASVGNHDMWQFKPKEIRQKFAASGFRLLINEGEILRTSSHSPLFVYGLDSFWSGKPDRNKALLKAPPNVPIIGLIHEPDPFEQTAKDGRTTLQLSGHTHGGQCRIPLIGYAPAKVSWGKKFIHGYYQIGESHLYVSSGLGTTALPIRFACRPEIALLTLRRSTPTA